MSDTKSPDYEDLIKKNPKVDGEQFREAQELLKEARDEGLAKPAYGIGSSHDRSPLTRKRASRQG